MSAVLYEVTLVVEAAIAREFEAWLHAHVRAIVALPGFTGGEVLRSLDPAPADGEVAWCCHYRLRDAAAFEDYLREHAPAMRADGLARFGTRFRATRRLLEVVAGA